MGPERPASMAGDSETIRQAVDFINMGKYQFADSVLNGIPGAERNARWYYLSALANYGLRNSVLAVERIQKALQLEPGNVLYQRTLQSFRYTENVYNRTGRNIRGRQKAWISCAEAFAWPSYSACFVVVKRVLKKTGKNEKNMLTRQTKDARIQFVATQGR